MRPEDNEALEAAAWAAFVQRLSDHLAGQWPAMVERLGERYGAFVDLAVQQAETRSFAQAASVARFVNLWFVWGPAWHDKPGFEWAQGLLAAPRTHEWLTAHQLVQRSLAELQRLPGARVEPDTLQRADSRLIDSFGPLGRRGAMLKAEPMLRPRAACDLEAVELRLQDDGGQQAYRLEGDEWQRAPLAAPPPLRIDAARPMPALVAVLSALAGQGAASRLQLRARPLAVCHGDTHPALAFSGPHGRWHWAGHETRAVSWPLAAREPAAASAGPGSLIAEETSPELHRIELQVCGLRDEGDAIGPLQATVAVWPAAQWWLEVQRAMPAAQALLPATRAWSRGVTRCRVERDGTPQDGVPLKQQFEDGLDTAVAVGLQRLAAAWEQVPGLSAPRFDATLGVLVGRAACTWGWRLGSGGMAGPAGPGAGPAGLASGPVGLPAGPVGGANPAAGALMRLVALLEMDACHADLQLGGELSLAGSRSRFTLQLAGQAPLRHRLQREAAQPTLHELLVPATARWRWPFSLALEPLADDTGCLLQQAGPVSGALVGEAGLRPCTHGSSGWEWFAGLRLEPVAVPLQVTDPLLGLRQAPQALLPALTLIDWSLG